MTDLAGADLRGSRIEDVDLGGAVLRSVTFEGAQLEGACSG